MSIESSSIPDKVDIETDKLTTLPLKQDPYVKAQHSQPEELWLIFFEKSHLIQIDLLMTNPSTTLLGNKAIKNSICFTVFSKQFVLNAQ